MSDLLLLSGRDAKSVSAVCAQHNELYSVYQSLSEDQTACLISSDTESEQTELMRHAAAHELDLNPIPERWKTKKPKLILFDVDSTLVEEEGIDVLADLKGIKDEVSFITEMAMQGKLDFKAALKARVGLIRGITADEVKEVGQRLHIRSGCERLVQLAKENQVIVACASGGFTQMVKPLMDHLGITEYRANDLVFDDEQKCLGEVTHPIVDGSVKAMFLMELCEKLRCRPEDTVVIADGANDVQMMRLSGLGVGLNPKPKLAAEADIVFRSSDVSALAVLFKWV